MLTLSLKEGKNRSLIHWREKKVIAVALCIFFLWCFLDHGIKSPYRIKMLFHKTPFITKCLIHTDKKEEAVFRKPEQNTIFIHYVHYIQCFCFKVFSTHSCLPQCSVHICQYPHSGDERAGKVRCFPGEKKKKSKMFYKRVLPLCFSSFTFFTIHMFNLLTGHKTQITKWHLQQLELHPSPWNTQSGI